MTCGGADSVRIVVVEGDLDPHRSVAVLRRDGVPRSALAVEGQGDRCAVAGEVAPPGLLSGMATPIVTESPDRT